MVGLPVLVFTIAALLGLGLPPDPTYELPFDENTLGNTLKSILAKVGITKAVIPSVVQMTTNWLVVSKDKQSWTYLSSKDYILGRHALLNVWFGEYDILRKEVRVGKLIFDACVAIALSIVFGAALIPSFAECQKTCTFSGGSSSCETRTRVTSTGVGDVVTVSDGLALGIVTTIFSSITSYATGMLYKNASGQGRGVSTAALLFVIVIGLGTLVLSILYLVWGDDPSYSIAFKIAVGFYSTAYALFVRWVGSGLGLPIAYYIVGFVILRQYDGAKLVSKEVTKSTSCVTVAQCRTPRGV